MDKQVDYVGFTVLPQAISAQHGQHLGFLPSQSRGTSLLHTGLGNTTASDNEAHFWERPNRDLKSHFFWITNYAKCSITRGLPCLACQVGRSSGLIKAVSSKGTALNRFMLSKYRDWAGNCDQGKSPVVLYNAQPQAALSPLVSKIVHFKIW